MLVTHDISPSCFTSHLSPPFHLASFHPPLPQLPHLPLQYRKTVRNDDDRLDFLMKVYDTLSIQQSILYANSKARVDSLSESLRKDDHSVSSMHSGLDRAERARVMKEFRAGATRVLVSSDLLGRGIDIPTVSLVVNVVRRHCLALLCLRVPVCACPCPRCACLFLLDVILSAVCCSLISTPLPFLAFCSFNSHSICLPV